MANVKYIGFAGVSYFYVSIIFQCYFFIA